MKPRSGILYNNEDIKGIATAVRSPVVKGCILATFRLEYEDDYKYEF